MKHIITIILSVILFLSLIITSAGAYEAPVAHASAELAAGTIAPSRQARDERVRKLSAYLKELNSPLAPYAEDFVNAADEHELNELWSMVAAIAGVESTFGKHTPYKSYNAWGWGIPTGAQSGIGFNDWDEGIFVVSQGLKENYIDRGAASLESIGSIYAPPSSTWAGKVRLFMNQIETTPIPPELELTI